MSLAIGFAKNGHVGGWIHKQAIRTNRRLHTEWPNKTLVGSVIRQRRRPIREAVCGGHNEPPPGNFMKLLAPVEAALNGAIPGRFRLAIPVGAASKKPLPMREAQTELIQWILAISSSM